MLRATNGTVLEYFVVEAKGPGAKLQPTSLEEAASILAARRRTGGPVWHR
ncbi:hypothetical protein G3469_12080 [Shewanella baltica]|nr:hypothetical protein [Shewanella baltica]